MLTLPAISLSCGCAASIISSCGSFVVVSTLRVVVVVLVVDDDFGGTVDGKFFGMVATGRTGLRGGYSSRTVPGKMSLSLLSSSSAKSDSGVVRCVVVVNRELVRTDVEVFLDGADVLLRVKVVAGIEGVGCFVVAITSSMHSEIGPLHCPVAVHVMTLGPSNLKPRGH
jgi:hypothetical protein